MHRLIGERMTDGAIVLGCDGQGETTTVLDLVTCPACRERLGPVGTHVTLSGDTRGTGPLTLTGDTRSP